MCIHEQLPRGIDRLQPCICGKVTLQAEEMMNLVTTVYLLFPCYYTPARTSKGYKFLMTSVSCMASAHVAGGKLRFPDKLQCISKRYDFCMGKCTLRSVRLCGLFRISFLDPAAVLLCLRRDCALLGIDWMKN